jgi:F0F1-type ATP synthase membrane subunit b/b'
MEAWIQRIFDIGLATVIGIVAFFLKRTLTHIEEQQKSIQETLNKRLDAQKQESEARANKTDQDVEHLRARLDGIVETLPRQYVQKEDWLLNNQNIDRKLDRIMEILMNLKGRGA